MFPRPELDIKIVQKFRVRMSIGGIVKSSKTKLSFQVQGLFTSFEIQFVGVW